MIKTLLISILSLLFLSGCFEPEPNADLKSTYWSLDELSQEDVEQAPNQPEPHLIFHINNNTFHGSDGCNGIKGSYTLQEGNFTVTSLVSTRMMCSEGMEQAGEILQVLTKARRLEIRENNLILYHADIEVARFEAKEDY